MRMVVAKPEIYRDTMYKGSQMYTEWGGMPLK